MTTVDSPCFSRTVHLPALVAASLKCAHDAIARQRWDDAVERVAGACVIDIQQHAQAFLVGAAESVFVGELYARCFTGAGLDRRRLTQRTTGHRRLAYIMPSIAEGQAASRRLVQMARHHDRARLDVSVIVTEEFTRRTPPATFLKWPDHPSVLAGATLMAELGAMGIEPVLIPAEGGYLDAARGAIERVRAMEVDTAVFVASPACPISAAMAWARIAPMQVNQNVAVPLVVEGIDGVIYHNAACATTDESELARRGIRLMTVDGNGTDLEAAARATPVDRAAIRVPRDAVVLASAGNRLPARVMAGTFAADLRSFMLAHPNVWWLAIGPGDFSAVIHELGAARSRVVLAGPQGDIRAWLKAADVYVNEYPEGGANTVLESMACGVPAVALRAGIRHTESIGAELCGDGMPDAVSYWRRVSEWASNMEARKENASAQGERVRERFGYQAICRAYERCYESLRA